jgi:hypothetical protein
VSKSELYALCAYGLHAQSFRGSDTRVQLPGVFKSVWYASTPPRSSGIEGPILHPSFGNAERLARSQALPYLCFSKRSNPKSLSSWSEERLVEGTFLVLCRAYVIKALTVKEAITDDVIIAAVRDEYDAVYSSLTSVQYKKLINPNYYILLYCFYHFSGDYALLCPEHVLPEFIIHTMFSGNSLRSSSSDYCIEQSKCGKRYYSISFLYL